MNFEDKTLHCIEENCPTENQEFIWTARDQAFYAEKGLSQPKRCPACREAKKASKNNRRDFGEKRNFSGGNRHDGNRRRNNNDSRK